MLEDLIKRPPSDPQLSGDDRRVLQALSLPGGALHKIFASMVDYADHMRDHIANADLDTPEGLALARQLKLKRDAVLENLSWIASQIQGNGPVVVKKD